jgi:uncharacterized membrane protein (UPF0127 family)
VHTFFMRFPMDVVFLDREGKVVKVVRNLKPWRAAGARGARSALELAAGEAARRGLDVGQRLELDAPDEEGLPQAAGVFPEVPL